MQNPKAASMALQLATMVRNHDMKPGDGSGGLHVVDIEVNVVTLEDTDLERYLITVETVFNADNRPLPAPEAHWT